MGRALEGSFGAEPSAAVGCGGNKRRHTSVNAASSTGLPWQTLGGPGSGVRRTYRTGGASSKISSVMAHLPGHARLRFEQLVQRHLWHEQLAADANCRDHALFRQAIGAVST